MNEYESDIIIANQNMRALFSASVLLDLTAAAGDNTLDTDMFYDDDIVTYGFENTSYVGIMESGNIGMVGFPSDGKLVSILLLDNSLVCGMIETGELPQYLAAKSFCDNLFTEYYENDPEAIYSVLQGFFED